MILYKNDIEQLRNLVSSHTKTFLLLDENTEKYCLQTLKDIDLQDVIKIVIPSGEQNKNIETVQFIWSQLVDNHADRKSLLINLGGGMVTDIGGFVASCYQRGIDFINIPTTLLGMIDAAVGGKTGIDFQGLKNQIGVFSQPLAVVVLFDFLETLPKREVLSGLAEIIKYGFIVDKSFLEAKYPLDPTFIIKAIEVKDEITRNDATEQGLRKILNFGHTIGHALETYLIDHNQEIRHGEGVALGMVSALYLSEKYCNLDHKWTVFYKDLYAKNFNRFNLNDIPVDELIEIMRHDKKNEGGDIRFVLIEDIGKPVYDVVVDLKYIIDSVNYLVEYQNDTNYWDK
ncbi:MAG: 3-dehydroquinate synthase [Bacteroidales bacterium]|nr:3-dehydroquinate synthase [Bacteroidales bacterium]